MRPRIRSGYARAAVVFFLFSIALWGAILAKASLDFEAAEQSRKFWSARYQAHQTATDYLTLDQVVANLSQANDRTWDAERWQQFMAWVAASAMVIPPVLVASVVWIWRGFKATAS